MRSTIFMYITCIVIAGAVVWWYVPLSQAHAIVAFEKAAMAVDPSAERAYRYGNRHFDALETEHFSIEIASHFYDQARTLDTLYPFLHHQLARIAFLRGDYYWAMREINFEIEHSKEPHTSSYYVRGLISGYMGDYDRAVQDFEYAATLSPHWATYTDLAWVLLSARRTQEARDVTEHALTLFPDNAWLLNAHAISLFESGELEKASYFAKRATDMVNGIEEEDWLRAYPGNDPLLAQKSVEEFREKVHENDGRISAALRAHTTP